ncbi:LmbE-like protein [Gymnopus androsaceus JB14]|uniref:N-acetylglucosaminylphosphatidylinositol deacetylase n=1 Tax=Gymnopus androsaceus JB14 TaxID=1447944 RepID=A0A6A4HM40_9AGAR|nr:LmbE-like protein [Gymnopus androsaceus JB14]
MFFSAFHVLILSVLIAALYRPTDSGNIFRNDFPESSDPLRILLVTAHPDDECLFFAPTILALTNRSRLADASIKQENDNELFSLCLSIGDADGLGHIRREEYEKSLDVLGIKDTNRIVLDDPHLQDNMGVSWDPIYIAGVVDDFVLQYNITTILTFDRGGVSGHPNHKSIPDGIKRMISAYAKYSDSIPPKLYMLITVPLTIKYDRLALMLERFGYENAHASVGDKYDHGEAMPVFVAGIGDYLTALQAMRQHWSQLVWFRWLNVMFSRYMWVNEWAEVRLTVQDNYTI